jgi:hypothetical protein
MATTDTATPQQPATRLVEQTFTFGQAARIEGTTVEAIRQRVEAGELKAIPSRVVLQVPADEAIPPHPRAHLDRCRTIYGLSNRIYTREAGTYRQAGLRSTDIAVLIALSFHYDEAKSAAWPAATTLGREVGLEEKNVRLSLKKLVGLGLLVVVQKSNPHPNNREATIYRFGPAIIPADTPRPPVGATDQPVRTVSRSKRPFILVGFGCSQCRDVGCSACCPEW